MLTEPIQDERAWTQATAGQLIQWYRPLPPRLATALAEVVERAPTAQPLTELRLTDELRRTWEESLAPARRDLAAGRGFVILEGLDSLPARTATGCYWLLGQLLGEPFAQNVQGTLLYDVRDTGQEVAAGARFSVTSYESSFHTDNSFGDEVLDYVGLLCLQTAKAGGISQNVNAYAVHNVLLREHPGVLERLYQPWHVDRRGGFCEGESPTVRRPIITWDGRELTVRYLRYWIEVGHDKAGQPLTADERRALDTFDAVLARPELRIEFALRPGEAYFINNRWILHNRTAFTDHPEPERRRHLVRLWLRAEDGT
jgi:alpha-ketoglutarate-dependent taurine dioxygenase